MCTVTWAGTDHGYVVWFNRDEQRTRPPAEPPRRQLLRGVACLAPVDPVGGGTWLSVNEYGLTLGLLNYYAAGLITPSTHPRSRGLLVRDLADASTPDEVWVRLAGSEWERYPPFLLVCFDAMGQAGMAQWDGHQLARRGLDAPGLLTTSSFRCAEVEARRRECYLALAPTVDDLRDFHAGRDPRGDAYSIWMSRPDAHTVSRSGVAVTENGVTFSYAPRGSDDRPGAEVVVALARR